MCRRGFWSLLARRLLRRALGSSPRVDQATTTSSPPFRHLVRVLLWGQQPRQLPHLPLPTHARLPHGAAQHTIEALRGARVLHCGAPRQRLFLVLFDSLLIDRDWPLRWDPLRKLVLVLWLCLGPATPPCLHRLCSSQWPQTYASGAPLSL